MNYDSDVSRIPTAEVEGMESSITSRMYAIDAIDAIRTYSNVRIIFWNHLMWW